MHYRKYRHPGVDRVLIFMLIVSAIMSIAMVRGFVDFYEWLAR